MEEWYERGWIGQVGVVLDSCPGLSGRIGSDLVVGGAVRAGEDSDLPILGLSARMHALEVMVTGG